MTEQVMKDMVDYIELTNNVINDYANRPALQKAAMEKTAGALTAAGLVPKEASDALLTSWTQDPNKVLEFVEKLAGMVTTDGADGYSIGRPVGVKKSTSKESEADRAFKARLGL